MRIVLTFSILPILMLELNFLLLVALEGGGGGISAASENLKDQEKKWKREGEVGKERAIEL